MLLRFVCITCLCLLIVGDVYGKVVFSSSRPRHAPGNPGQSNIYVMNSDGSDLTRLTHDGGLELHPTWSPDGRQIAYECTGRGWDICVISADGNNQQNITRDEAIDFREAPWDHTPSWHPDENRIAFRSYIWDADETHIYVINIDDGQIEKLIENAGIPHFSPDGSRIAFQGHDFQIYVANADGTNPWRLSEEKDVELGGWSPDSKQILYSQLRGQLDTWLLFIVTVDPVFDGNQGFPKRKIRMPIRFADPTFGADGKSILFSGHSGGKRWHIYRLYLENERFIQLTFGEFVDDTPQEWKSPLSISPRGKVPSLWGKMKEK